MNQWLSVHLHFDGSLYGADGDRVLLQVLAPTIEDLRKAGAVDTCFFVRYGQDGPHLRLRISQVAPPSKQWSQARLDRLLRERCDGVGVDPRWQPYEPELARYGGSIGMPISERFFEVGSILALTLVRDERLRADRKVRHAGALMSAVVLAGVFAAGDRAVAVRTLRGFGRSTAGLAVRMLGNSFTAKLAERTHSQLNTIRPFVRESWRRLVEREPLTPALDEFRVGVERTREALLVGCGNVTSEQPNSLMKHVEGSYFHMTNNRLGVLPSEESYIAELAARSLSDEDPAIVS